jgi:hypothetical protein
MADAPEPTETSEEKAITTLQGPVRLMDARLVLCVPLAAGGDKLNARAEFPRCTRVCC